MSVSVIQPEAPWHVGLRSARANLLPGLFLQLVALVLVVLYYHYEPLRAALTQLASFKERSGLIYGIVATAFFGGLLPCLYLKTSPATRGRYDFLQNLCLTVFWGYKGAEVDIWYRILARTIGEDHHAGTVVTKMFLDQFVYCPLFAVPISTLVYAWCEYHFDTAAVVKDFRAPHWYRRRVLAMLISNLGVWVPAVCIIYALPTSLQLPLFNLVLCFFTLMLAHMAQHTNQRKTAL